MSFHNNVSWVLYIQYLQQECYSTVPEHLGAGGEIVGQNICE